MHAQDHQTITVFTVGHSTHDLDAFIEMMRAHGIAIIADIRTVPRSRHNPQFNRESLPDSLAAAGIGYRHLPDLGGLRRQRVDSPNTAWRHASFRGFADYMQTEEFRRGLDRLIYLAGEKPVAIMCAEAVPWRCHRSLIADALVARGLHVCHIMGRGECRRHELHSFAKVQAAEVTYPSPAVEEQPSLPEMRK